MLINLAVVFLAFRKNWKMVSITALIITWCLLLGSLAFEYSLALTGVAIGFSIAFYLLFVIDALLVTAFRKVRMSRADILQVCFCNVLLYVAMLLAFPEPAVKVAVVTGSCLLYAVVMLFIVRYYLAAEKQLLKLVSIQALALMVLYIIFQWDGILVTFLWLAMAIALFIAGVRIKQSWLRVCAFPLVAMTLLKLVSVDVLKFSTGERILCFIVIGVLLLVGSFYYQRFNVGNKVK